MHHLEQAFLVSAHLKGADLTGTHLEGAILNSVNLEGANLNRAHLQGASLYKANLSGTDLREAHLEGADLSEAHLEGKYQSVSVVLEYAQKGDKNLIEVVPPADLRRAYFDAASNLENIILGERRLGSALLADVHWGDVNLSVVDWTSVKMLGDEYSARQARRLDGKLKLRHMRIVEFEVAIRANRQLAVRLQDQGLNEFANHFAYRAEVLKKALLFRQRNFLGTLISSLLDLLSGYGYKPFRSFITYLLIILVFALIYLILGSTVGRIHVDFEFSRPLFTPVQAFIFSVTSFHGRGFFSPAGIYPEGTITLNDIFGLLSTLESVLGFAIEIILIMTFTLRYLKK